MEPFATASTRPERRALSVALVVVASVVATLLGPIAGSQAAEWIVLCTGYDACRDAGYSDSGYEEASGTSYWSQYPGHNCTNYVAYRLVQNGLPNTRPASLSGNASNWGPSFPAQTNDSPALGAVAWWDTSFSSTGHVAYVEQVVSPTEILVSEDNWGGDFRWRRVTQGGGGWPTGFIHLADQAAPVAPDTRTWQLTNPARILDTRTGTGTPVGRLGAGEALTFAVAGRGGLPPSGVGMVLLTVNVIKPSVGGYVTAHASGTAQPSTRNVSFRSGGSTTQTIVVPVGADGKVRVYSSAATDLSADVYGWSPAGGYVTPVTPARVLDTRSGVGAPKAKLAAGATLSLPVAGRAGVPSSGAQAVVLQVSASGATGTGWLTAWQSGTSRPSTQHVRYELGRNSTGLVTARLGSSGAVTIHSTAQTDVMVDVVGWVPTGADQVALRPVRVADSQAGIQLPVGRVGAGAAPLVRVTGRGGVPSTGVRAVLLTVTAFGPLASGYLTAYPDGSPETPYASLKYSGGHTAINTVVVPVGAAGAVRVRTSAATYLKVAVQGYIAS